MILLVDVGNSNICLSKSDEVNLSEIFRVKTSKDKSGDEYYYSFKEFVGDDIDDVIISSVVPVITSSLVKLFKKYYNINPKVIGNKLKTGINIIADDPKSCGADLICDAAGASLVYDEGLVIDLGTASKFIYYKNKTILGISIAPGVATSLNSMVSNAALLPSIELTTPKKILNNSTIPCMQSGVIYGFSSLVDGLIKSIKAELNKEDLKVIATGGLISLIAPNLSNKIDVVDDLLTLKGINAIYMKNKR